MGLNNSLFFAEHATESSIESQKVTPKKITQKRMTDILLNSKNLKTSHCQQSTVGPQFNM